MTTSYLQDCNKDLLQNIVLKIEIEDDFYIISEEIFNVYGLGKTLEEAYMDYCFSFIEYYKLTK